MALHSPAPSAAPRFVALRPFDPQALARATRLDTASFAALGAEAWDDLVTSLQTDPSRTPALSRALAWGLEAPALLRWVCLAARLEEVVSERAERSGALICAERWAREGQDDVRYEAYRLAREEDFATPAALAALAVYVSGPSLAPEGAPPEPPSPNLGASTALGALMAVAVSEALGAKGFDCINTIGLDLACGQDGKAGARRALALAQQNAAQAVGGSE